MVRVKGSGCCRRSEDTGNDCRAQLQHGGGQLSAGRGDLSLRVWHQEAVPFLLPGRAASWQRGSCGDRTSWPASVGKGRCLGEETLRSQIFLPGSTLQPWLQGPDGAKSGSAQTLNCCGALSPSSPLMMSPASAAAGKSPGNVRFGLESLPCLPPPRAGPELHCALLCRWPSCRCRAVFPSQSCISPAFPLLLSQK